MSVQASPQELLEKVRDLEKKAIERDRLEEELRKSEETARVLLNAIPDRALLLDREGVILALNSTAAEAFGKSADELIGSNAFALFPPDIAEKRKAYHDRTVSSGKAVHYEDRREGRWLDTHLYPVFDRSGKVVLVAVYSRDITGFKQVEEDLKGHRDRLEELVSERTAELRKANERLLLQINERRIAEENLKLEKKRLESLIEHSSLAIVTVNENHEIVSCNKYFEKLFQFEEHEMKGKKLDRIIGGQEHLEEAVSYTKRTMEGEPIHGSGRRYRKDGTLIDVEFYGVPVIIEGKVVGAYGIYEDISNLKEAQQALRESEKKFKRLYEESKRAEEVYRSLIHSSADAIVIYDLEGNTQYVSPAFSRLFGWSAEEVIGKRIPFVPESEREKTMEIIRDLVENGTPCQGFETKRYTKDGRLLDISISASRYDDHKGRPAGMLVTLRDISERKELEAQLLQAHKMEAIGTLAGGVAHDFNNILQAISGYTQLLMMGKSRDDPDYGKLEAIQKSAERAGELTRRLLIFGRKVESKLRPVDLNHEVEQVVRLLERTIPRMVTIELHLSRDLEIINADPVQLEQIMMNLGVNARDAMPDGGKLSFETRNVTLDHAFCRAHPGAIPGSYAMLSITDTGCGMDKEILDHIYEPFFTTKETGKGTGLGLAMVYGIVKSHRGYITCESQKGQGTCFKIYFPALESIVEEEMEEDRENHIAGGKETILLVDDEKYILEIGRDMLEQYGYTTFVAESGEKAVEVYRAGNKEIDLIVLDLNMPGMGGHRCLEKLLEINPAAKVIIASGYSQNAEVKRTMNSGAVGFIGKPYRLVDMLKKVREVLDRS